MNSPGAVRLEHPSALPVSQPASQLAGLQTQQLSCRFPPTHLPITWRVQEVSLSIPRVPGCPQGRGPQLLLQMSPPSQPGNDAHHIRGVCAAPARMCRALHCTPTCACCMEQDSACLSYVSRCVPGGCVVPHLCATCVRASCVCWAGSVCIQVCAEFQRAHGTWLTRGHACLPFVCSLNTRRLGRMSRSCERCCR